MQGHRVHLRIQGCVEIPGDEAALSEAGIEASVRKHPSERETMWGAMQGKRLAVSLVQHLDGTAPGWFKTEALLHEAPTAEARVEAAGMRLLRVGRDRRKKGRQHEQECRRQISHSRSVDAAR